MSGLADLRLGFVPLTDCAPLLVARTMGFFVEEGLNVELSREASWATIRDKVSVGALEGAHMLAPMALACSLGVGGLDVPTPMIAPLALNRNGSAITISKALADVLREIDPDGMAQSPISARPLARLVAMRRETGARPLTFAVVFPHSMHAYELRYWLADAGVDPDRDVRLVVTPPSRMVEQLRLGGVDGFCVGAPWNAVAVHAGLGEILIKASEFWPGSPDKVLGIKADWAELHPDELKGVLRALIRAQAWADDPTNRADLVDLLARPEHVDAAPEAVAWALEQEIVFHRDGAGRPRREDALWFLSQMARWGQVPADLDLSAAADAVYRPDLYANASESRAIDAPPTAFFDGGRFDPAHPLDYAKSFAIDRLKP